MARTAEPSWNFDFQCGAFSRPMDWGITSEGNLHRFRQSLCGTRAILPTVFLKRVKRPVQKGITGFPVREITGEAGADGGGGPGKGNLHRPGKRGGDGMGPERPFKELLKGAPERRESLPNTSGSLKKGLAPQAPTNRENGTPGNAFRAF